MASTFSVERVIDARPEAVLDAATDIHAWPEVVPAIDGVQVLTPGPVGLGTRFRETRTMFKREATEEMEFVDFDRPRRYALHAESHGSKYHTTFTLTPEGESMRINMRFDIEPQTRAADFMGLLFRPFMKKMADLCGKDLDAIKAHIELGSPPGAGSRA